ncbi:hypothetical protein NA57DRAFT_48207 [Rhizodiscina lignyota]|uniref:Zn(2)-C6 fungal-type domain-containing protein n=1 Tax=Rhizodiscina lignyota TaxID=1504668 RepID=A0A9P4I7V6_9PEZI|nr:hypothetical protein NA57DRAFT_48207 [Rhizodiscina lignyota]
MTRSDGQPPRKRARQACHACNARRVKCNVIESLPCDNCAAAGISCEIRESRRGRHPRQSRASISRDSDLQQTADHDAANVLTHLRADSGAASSHALPALSQNSRSSEVPSDDTATAQSPKAPLDSSRPEDDGAVFLGESTSIRYVEALEDRTSASQQPGPPSPESLRLRHSVPNAVKNDNSIPAWEAGRREARINSLQEEGVFSFPEDEVVRRLVRHYFQWFHPCFAIVDEPNTRTLLLKGLLSPLLLNAILFIGVIHCDDDDLRLLDQGNRHQAKFLFYHRAKDIYDADIEDDNLTVIRALFLMSFWREGPLFYKDTRHWLSAAISLAQSKALHRSVGTPEAWTPEAWTAKLKKRLWWSIYVRERQCAAALGLPNRIRDEDCDIEVLDTYDFQAAFPAWTSHQDKYSGILYQTSMVGLSKILGDIIHYGYLPGRSLTASQRSLIQGELIEWKQSLPKMMVLPTDFDEQPGFHTNMLHLAYNNLLILLYRSDYISNEREKQDGDGNIALQAAIRNSRIIEDMLPEGKLRHAQIHVITNLFNTLCIHTISLRRSSGPARAIAEHRAKLCLLGLQELQKTWEVKNGVLQLFFQYLDRSTAAQLRMQDEGKDTNPPTPGGASLAEQNHNIIPQSHPTGNVLDAALASDSPWSWSTEEANQFLFSQIENDFAFGEGGNGILNWSPEDTFGNMLP